MRRGRLVRLLRDRARHDRWPPPGALSSQRMGWAFRVASALLSPLLALFTLERWAGREQVPTEGGVLVVANHLSDVDPLVLSAYLCSTGRIPHFLAKQELFHAPLVGRLLRAAAQLPVRRDTPAAGAALRQALDALSAGHMIVLFPEAQETTDPAYWPEIGKRGAAVLAMSTQVPVVPVAVWGTQGIRGHRHTARLLPRSTVSILAGPPVDLSAWRQVDESQLTDDLLDALVDELMSHVLRLETALREESPPPRVTEGRTGVRATGPS